METPQCKTDTVDTADHERGTVDTHQECERLVMEATLNAPERRSLPYHVQMVAQAIDHTYLTITDPVTDTKEVIRVCREAQEYGFASVCIRPEHVSTAAELFHAWAADDVRICTVIGFPGESGYDPQTFHDEHATPYQMLDEVDRAIADGADEFDMVMNTRMVLDGDVDGAEEGVYAVVHAIREENREDGGDRKVKVIIEAPYLREKGGVDALHHACQAVIAGEADYIKTSTGFKPAGIQTGATIEDVMLMVGECKMSHNILVKESGGISSAQDAKAFLTLGASRIGTSKGVNVIEEMLRNS